MNITAYKFSKRLNSTAIPTSAGTVFNNVVLKSVYADDGSVDTSILKPDFLLTHTGLFDFNYIYAFGVYYFITDIKYGTNNLVLIKCEIDVLATYKIDILNTDAKVIYSASNYSIHIDDKRNALTNAYVHQTATTPFKLVNTTQTFLNEYYVVTTIGRGGFSITQFLTPQQYADFANYVLDVAQLAVWEELESFFGAATNAIVAVKKTRLDLSNTGKTSAGHVVIGTYTVEDVNCEVLNSQQPSYTLQTATIAIPHIFGDYRDGDMCSQYEFIIPFCGKEIISADELYGYSELKIDYTIDLTCMQMTGIAYVLNNDNQRKTITLFNGNLSQDIPIGQVVSPETVLAANAPTEIMKGAGIALGIGGTIGAVAATAGLGAPVALLGAELGIGVGALNVAESVTSKARDMTGKIGGGLGYNLGFHYADGQFRLTQIAQETCDNPDTVRPILGRPCNKTVRLSTLTGFCQCVGASVNSSALTSVRNSINNFLNSGFYIE